MSVIQEEFAKLQAELPALADWRIEVSSRATVTMGLTYHTTKVIRIAEWLVLRGTRRELLDTIRHEAAHAVLGKNEGHGPKWKALAKRLGATPKAQYDDRWTAVTAKARRYHK